MSPRRIAFAAVLLWSAFCLALAAVVFVNLCRIESPERYIALGLGLVMLYMGGSMLAGLIWPPKPKDPNAPIEIPPLDQVRGRTSYRDDRAMSCNAILVIGAIFLAVSLGAAAEQPPVLVFAVVAVGVLAGVGVMIWRQIQYGRARLELDAPARRGDAMRGLITTSGSGWAAAGHSLNATVELAAIQSFRAGGKIGVGGPRPSVRRHHDRPGWQGHHLSLHHDHSGDRYQRGTVSWNVQLETRTPKYCATILIDVA